MASSGTPTVEIEVKTNESSGRASVPTGTSTGKYEVNAFVGSAADSIKTFNSEVGPTLLGAKMDELDDVLSIEKNVEKFIPKIGGNPILCLSYTLLRNLNKDVYKVFGGLSIPYQVCNIIGGGSHAEGTEFQEFHVIPMTKDYPRSMEVSGRIHKLTGEKLRSKKVGLEGAWVSTLGNRKSLEVLHEVAKSVSDETGVRINLGLDIAAAEFYRDGKYIYKDKKLDKGEQIELVLELAERFSLHYLEDPLHDDDFEGFAELQKKTKCMVVGDDLFATNASRLRPVCKAAIVKPNQVGTLHKVIEFLQALGEHGVTPVMSHRSGETNDTILADLAVGLETPYIKVSAFGAERTAKMERLNDIYNGCSRT
jgi:enolase